TGTRSPCATRRRCTRCSPDASRAPRQTRPMADLTPRKPWTRRLRGAVEGSVIRGDDWIDAAFDRFNTRFGRHRPQYIAAYRSFADAQGVELFGRVLAEAPLGGPGE